MAQVTLYMDDDTQQRMRAAAKAAGLSMSAWLVAVVRERIAGEWPADVLALQGAWDDFPEADELRQSTGADVPRDEL